MDFYFHSVPGKLPDVPAQPPVLLRRMRWALIALAISLVCVLVEVHRENTFERSAVGTTGTVTATTRKTTQWRSHRYNRPFKTEYAITFEADDGTIHTFRYGSINSRDGYPAGEPITGDRITVWYVPGDPSNFSVGERVSRSSPFPFILTGLIAILVWLWSGWDYLTVRPRHAAPPATPHDLHRWHASD